MIPSPNDIACFGRQAIISGSIALGLFCTSAPAQADIKYPSAEDLRGFQTACAGGHIKEVKGSLDGALQTWRLKPAAELQLDVAIKELGAIIAQVKGGNDSRLYEAYANCVQKLILDYLHLMNPAPASQAPPLTSDKPRS